MGPCGTASKWAAVGSTLRPTTDNSKCLTRNLERLALQPCDDARDSQKWTLPTDGAGIVADLDEGICLDNMQREAGPAGLYGCHKGGTQLWTLSAGALATQSRPDVCLGIGAAPVLDLCAAHDDDFVWERTGDTLRPTAQPAMCLTRAGGKAVLQKCADTPEQKWALGS
eukprot:m.79753 g.79753  ORF g.79753 m.79753 type:complete len:169 (-) comp8011_c1_seq1:105-611(-)